ncbi:SNARE transport protein [Fusarium fujikuroi]|nr:SNARE transport protein [Fusarium fujikuroi]
MPCESKPSNSLGLRGVCSMPETIGELKDKHATSTIKYPILLDTVPHPTNLAMKKFGFGKKGDDGDDANRHALFGRKKSSQSSTSENPYAKQGGKDPYADDAKYANVTPYQQARAGLNNGPAAQAPNSYGAPAPAQGSFNSQPQPPSGYGADRYGSGGGYGGNRYGDSAPQNRYNSPGPAAGARGPGGYGGFGPSEPDTNRDNFQGPMAARTAVMVRSAS